MMHKRIYAIMLYVGLVTAIATGDFLARRSGLDPARVVAVALLMIPFMLAGARALTVAIHWSYFSHHPREMLRLDRGGAAMYGALPPALLLSVPLTRLFDLSFGAFWDVAIVSILAGMIPTRLGCLGAGCCAGRETRSALGMRLRNIAGVSARRFPTQLYEALLAAVLLALAASLWASSPFPGAVALAATAAYGLGRLLSESLREEREPRLAGLGAHQWMSLVLAGIGLVGIGLGGFALRYAAEGGPSPAAALPPAGGLGHVAAAALLLIPIMSLFRFLGCTLLFKPLPTHALQMLAVVPDVGTGEASARMELEREPDFDQISESPVDLLPAGVQPDGRLAFEAIAPIPEGSYRVRCIVSRQGALTRTGTCSGELDGPGLIVAFQASDTDGPTQLPARFCFEPIP